MVRIEKISKLISFILNPFFFSCVVFSILILSNTILSLHLQLFFLFICILFSNIFPISYLLYLKHKKLIDTIEIDHKDKRITPLSLGIICHCTGFVLLFLLKAPLIVTGLMFCYATINILIILITLYWKVSIHAIGASIPLVALSYQFGKPVYPLYILIIIIGLARIILKKHTPLQVIAGSFIGLLFTVIQLEWLFI
jgi:membrane-associated phospholipid phosphatase